MSNTTLCVSLCCYWTPRRCVVILRPRSRRQLPNEATQADKLRPRTGATTSICHVFRNLRVWYSNQALLLPSMRHCAPKPLTLPRRRRPTFCCTTKLLACSLKYPRCGGDRVTRKRPLHQQLSSPCKPNLSPTAGTVSQPLPSLARATTPPRPTHQPSLTLDTACWSLILNTRLRAARLRRHREMMRAAAAADVAAERGRGVPLANAA